MSKILQKLGLAGFHPVLTGLIVFSFVVGPIISLTTLFSSIKVLGNYEASEAPAITTPIQTFKLTSSPTIENTSTTTPTPTQTTTPTETATPTITFTPTITTTPTVTLPAAAGAQCVPAENERVIARVVGITDGDTITVNIDGQTFSLRYIGIDSPETGSAQASQATNANSWLVNGQIVTLVKDVSETDRYDRLLRYVFVGDTFVNYELVRAGWATSGSWPPDTSCDQVFAAAEKTARSNKVGLWVPTVTPKPYIPLVVIPPTQPSAGSSGNCDPSYPEVCIPPSPPDLDCGDITFKRFKVTGSDPHRFDGDHDGIGCEG